MAVNMFQWVLKYNTASVYRLLDTNCCDDANLYIKCHVCATFVNRDFFLVNSLA